MNTQEINQCLDILFEFTSHEFQQPLLKISNLTLKDNHQSVNEYGIQTIQFEQPQLHQFYSLPTIIKYQSTSEQLYTQQQFSTQEIKQTDYDREVPSLWQTSLRNQIEQKIQQNKQINANNDRQCDESNNKLNISKRLYSKSPQSQRQQTKMKQDDVNNQESNITSLHKKNYQQLNSPTYKQNTQMPFQRKQSTSPFQSQINQTNSTLQIKLDIQKFLQIQQNEINQKQSEIKKSKQKQKIHTQDFESIQHTSKSPNRSNLIKYKCTQYSGTSHISINLFKK